METNETFAPIPPPPDLVLTREAQSYLRESGKWANFLGILGFISCSLLLISALFVGTMFSVLSRISPAYSDMPAGMGAIFSIVIILVDVLYFFFALYLYQFASSVKKGIGFTDENHLTQGLGKLKSFFKLWGVLTIISICLNVLAIIAGIIIAVGTASMMHN